MKNMNYLRSSFPKPYSYQSHANNNESLFGHLWDLIDCEPRPINGRDSEYRNAHWFVHLFSPRLDIYALPDYDPLSDRGWISENGQLGLDQIEKALNKSGYEYDDYIGWFSSISPRAICLRIAVDTTMWSERRDGGVEISSNVRDEYKRLISQFSVPPSIVALGPYGLLVYYLLRDGIYYETLEAIVSSMIQDCSTRFIQTTKAALPIPEKKLLLDSTTLKSARWGIDGGMDWEGVPVYQPSQLFGTDWKYRIVATTTPRIQYVPKEPAAKSGSRHEFGRRRVPTVEEVETHILPFQIEMVEEQLFVAVLACHGDGLDTAQTLQKVKEWIDESPQCIGQFNQISPCDLHLRVEAVRGLAHLVHWPVSSTETFLSDVEPIVERHPFGAESAGTVRRFLTELSHWQLLHDQVGDDPDMLAMFNDKYPFYRHHRCLGLYPLPSEMIKSWSAESQRYIEWLSDIGVLHDAGFEYRVDGICRYFFITLDNIDSEVW